MRVLIVQHYDEKPIFLPSCQQEALVVLSNHQRLSILKVTSTRVTFIFSTHRTEAVEWTSTQISYFLFSFCVIRFVILFTLN